MSWYLDIVSPGWKGIIKNNYEFVFPVPVKKKKGIYFSARPCFTQQLGISGKCQLKEKEEVYNLLEKNFKLVELTVKNGSETENKKWKVKENRNFELNLAKNIDAIRKKYSENCKRNLRKSEKTGVRISEKITIDETLAFFRKTKGRELKEMKKEHYRVLHALYEYASAKKNAHIITALNKQHAIISTALFLEYNNRSYLLLAASSEEGKKTGASCRVIDHYISKRCTEDHVLDFEGSNVPGLARFYSGFGAEEKKYYSVFYNNLPFYLKWLKK